MTRLQQVLGPYSMLLGGLTVLAAAASGLLFVLLPELRQASVGMLAVAGVLALVFVASSLDGIRAALVGRQARYGTNTIIMVAAFIGILSMVNYLGSQYRHRFDMTASGEFTLSRHTQTVLKGLKDDIKVIGFFVERDPDAQASQQQAANLLKEYRYYTDKLSYEFVDPDDKPAIARQYEIRNYGAIVFTAGSHKQQIFGVGEQDFTGAILNVTGVQQKKVYLLTGHGEHDMDADADEGLSFARRGLETDNYRVESIDLATAGKVPDDSAVLVVAGPKKPILPVELAAIDDYLRRGGKAMFLLDPGPQQEVKELLAKWALAFKDGTVVDSYAYAQPDFATPAVLPDQYMLHQITKDLQTTFFPGATAIFFNLPEEDRDHIQLSPLARTSQVSWQTTAEVSSGQPSFTEGKDAPGPVLLAAAVEAQGPIGGKPSPGAASPTRLVVVGDSDFASNRYFYSKFNSDLFLNSVNWLGAQEELISIRPKPPQYRRLVITQRAWNWILYSSIGFLPGMVLLAGGISWWRRR